MSEIKTTTQRALAANLGVIAARLEDEQGEGA